MQDDKNTAVDEDFEDIDFEDLDTDDELDDGSWDDFDDGDGDGESGEESRDTGAAVASGKEKTFLQKNFTMIVVAIVLLGGGGFAFLKFGAPAATPSNQQAAVDSSSLAQGEAMPEQPADIADLNNDFPPMPAPIEGVGNDQIALNSDEIDSLDLALQGDVPGQAEPDVLTPLPSLSAESDASALADLDLPLADLDLSIEETAQDSAVADLEISATDDALLMLEPDTNVAPVEDIVVDDLTLELPVEEIATAPDPAVMETDIGMALTPQDEANDTSALENTISSLESTLTNNENALEQAGETEAKLSADLASARGEIETLNTKIADLQNEVSALKASATKQAQPVKAAAAPQKKAETAEKQGSTASKSPAAKPTPKPPILIQKDEPLQWVLRSAGPGEATISPQDSGDMRRVEVGDNVAGLGRVQSIAIENGRWVVRGPKGFISQ